MLSSGEGSLGGLGRYLNISMVSMATCRNSVLSWYQGSSSSSTCRAQQSYHPVPPDSSSAQVLLSQGASAGGLSLFP